MLVLDTCALLWYTLAPEKLSQKAQECCKLIPKNGASISSISLWEIGLRIKSGKLEIGTSTEDYIARIKSYTPIKIVPVNEDLWLKNLQLDWEHRDPADRTIVATSLVLGFPLVTSDQKIRSYYDNCLW